ncbi:HNH endonuclease [Paramixta manurensis]|uniref:HNH endonuclease n=1 Tax=Paramixta manurensis TaxID=2740817 RepID=A0A6M8U6R4_9GAMM|nr:HNH endonuclease [Erwiniaceae bacterium PD-1]
MSVSLPGCDLFYLPRDNLAPERYALITQPIIARRYICDHYEFFDENTSPHIIAMRHRYSSLSTLHQPAGGKLAQERLKRMVLHGQVIMLDRYSAPGRLFYIDDQGQLICRHPWLFELSGADHIIRAYRDSVACRDYRHHGGKPQATSFTVYAYGSASTSDFSPQQASSPQTFNAINSKMAGRLLAAGGIYHQNPQMYAETARQLGGEAAAGFDQVLNQQTAGSLIALSSLLAAGRLAVHPASITELEKLKHFLGSYKGEKTLLQNIEVVKMYYIKRPAEERLMLRREFDRERKKFLKFIA